MDNYIIFLTLFFLLMILMGSYIIKFINVLWSMFHALYAIINWILSLTVFSFDFTYRFTKRIAGKQLHSARFAHPWEVWKVINPFNFKHGLRLSHRRNLSEKRSYQHLILIATTGRNKTTSYCLPNLLDVNDETKKNKSFIVTDLSGEIFRLSSGHLSELGYSIQVINLQEPGKSSFFNPLIRSQGDKAKLRRVITTIVKSVIKGSGDTFWSESAIDCLITLASSILNHPDDSIKTISSLRLMLSKLQTNELDDFMATYSPDEICWSDYKSLITTNEKTLSSIIATARTTLNLFSIDPAVVHIFSKDTLDIASLRKSPGILYIICPESKILEYSVALNLINDEIFSYLIETPLDDTTIPLFYIMDEAGNQYQKDLDIVLTTCRKRNVSVSLIAQSLSQFQDRYGQRAKTILFGGVNTHIIMPGLPHETTKEYSEALGMRTIEDGNGSEKQVPLVSPDELRMMKHPIMITGARRPIRLKDMKPYFKERRLRRFASKPSYHIDEVPLVEPPLLDVKTSSSSDDDVDLSDNVVTLTPSTKEDQHGQEGVEL